MDYLPGIIHEKYQASHYYEIMHEFTISILDNARERDLRQLSDWEELTYSLDLDKGDIICIRFFKSTQTATPYAYIDFHISDDDVNYIKQETIISKEFIDLNSFIFDNITLQYQRDLKINQIINEGVRTEVSL